MSNSYDFYCDLLHVFLVLSLLFRVDYIHLKIDLFSGVLIVMKVIDHCHKNANKKPCSMQGFHIKS